MAKKDLETLPNWRDAFNSPTTVRNQRTKDNVGILLYAYTPVLVIFQDVTKSLFGWPAKQFDCVIELYGTLGPISLLELLTAVRTISSAFFEIIMVWMNFCIIWYDIYCCDAWVFQVLIYIFFHPFLMMMITSSSISRTLSSSSMNVLAFGQQGLIFSRSLGVTGYARRPLIQSIFDSLSPSQ